MTTKGCSCGEGAALEDTSSQEFEAPSCAPKLVLSHEEEAVLKVMRGLTEEARALRAELKGLEPQANTSRCQELAERLERLRLLFRAQKEELRLANEEKLRRLGHIP